jgi:hypothetical protein
VDEATVQHFWDLACADAEFGKVVGEELDRT